MVMDGEIEEPFSFSFQADSFHSGSISFGRFENEDLLWERRSSFSHNRYVEEVEKCLKPGSVIKKKAYFEAHFKKKGLPRPNLPEYHNDADYQVCENGVLESDAYGEEFEHVNEGSCYVQFDENLEGSEYPGDCEVTECEKEDPEASLFNPQRVSSLNDDDILVDCAVEDVNSEEAHQPVKGCDNFSSIIDEPETDKNRNSDAVNAEESSISVNLCPNTEPSEKVDETIAEKVNKTIAESWQSTSSKLNLKAAKESKFSKPRVNSKANNSQVQTIISAETSKDPTKNSHTREREGTRRTDKEKLSSKTAMPTTHLVRRTPKLEESRGLKGKSVYESSDKESRGKKLGEPQAPASKSESKGRQAANRPNHRVNLTKSDTRSSVATFNFKSSERAERRKEFFMKLEKKMLAKEDEMSKIQARKQEKTEAEIKQFRKSLNFKAAPMPSFYHVAMTSGPDGSKAVFTKISKVQSKSTSPGSGDAGGLPSHSEAGKDEASTASDFVNTTESLDASRETNCMMSAPSESSPTTLTPLSSKNLSRDAGTKIEVTKTKEREKDTSLQKHQLLEGSKVAKSQKTEGKQKVGAERNNREMGRKGMKGVGFGSSSRMGHLAVGVAS